MRRIFRDRARLVVYFEAEDLPRMLVQARSEGKTLVEWAREALLEHLADNSEVRPERTVSVVRRGVAAPERRVGIDSDARSESKAKLCRHNLPNCTVCG